MCCGTGGNLTYVPIRIRRRRRVHIELGRMLLATGCQHATSGCGQIICNMGCRIATAGAKCGICSGRPRSQHPWSSGCEASPAERARASASVTSFRAVRGTETRSHARQRPAAARCPRARTRIPSLVVGRHVPRQTVRSRRAAGHQLAGRHDGRTGLVGRHCSSRSRVGAAGTGFRGAPDWRVRPRRLALRVDRLPGRACAAMRMMGIREVWSDNLVEELDTIMEIIDRYPYVSVDTEFPGVVIRPITSFSGDSPIPYRYQIVRSNVDFLQLIQVAFSFCDENNNKPDGVHTWQFNLKFDINSDFFSQDSIDMLIGAGIDFGKLATRGIDSQTLAEQLIVSGLVLNPDVQWLAFHAGFDFAYLLRMLSGHPLPKTHAAFVELLSIFFPNIYDVKQLMRSCESLHGGLGGLADALQLTRIGPEHQAGSDALLTADAFFAIRSKYFDNVVDPDKFKGAIYGLT